MTRSKKVLALLIAPVLSGALLLGASTGKKAASKVEYNRDIRPIISENCFTCHGVDSAARKGGLRLDRFEDAIAVRKDSKPAIVPGKPEESEAVRRIFADDPDDLMPPVKSHKKLTTDQKALLKQWIAEGAKYEPHWSLIAPVRPAAPQVRNKKAVRNPIDNFIVARLEQEGLSPAAEADRRTLARRVCLDLTGLPPGPEQVDAFLKDKSPDAYEKYVDRLMATPQWGEHRARYWLDAARYGDSNGIHIDDYREIWPYRDWVISAFNRNLPYDQFTIEQLAGDLLPKPTMEQKIATGFNRCNITTSEGGAIDDEYYVLYDRDRTETTSQVWLGLTAGCAVCHDHKYDRFSQKEFYSMAAFFNNTTQKAMDGNVKDTPPVIVVPLEKDRARFETLSVEKETAEQAVAARATNAHADFTAWLPRASADSFTTGMPKDVPVLRVPLSDDKPDAISAFVSGKETSIALATNATWQKGSIASKAFTTSSKTTPEIPEAGDFERDHPFSYAAWVRLTDSRDGAVFARMDDKAGYRGWDLWLEGGGKPGTHIISKWEGNAIKVIANKAIEPKRWTHVCITYDGSSKAAGVSVYLDGEKQATSVQADTLKDSIRTKTPFKIGQRRSSSPIERAGLQDIRLYERALTGPEIKALGGGSRLAWLLTQSNGNDASTIKDKASDELYKGWLSYIDPQYHAAKEKVQALAKGEMEIKARAAVTHIMNEKPEPPMAYVLNRGEYAQRKEKVAPATPEALPPMAPDLPRNRLGFAKWLMAPENPLTARVAVNRFWQELFGTGIVKTTSDFGVAGEMPSHQELLDWLAGEFRDSGWDMKRMYKMMVTSATYRQKANVTPEKLAKDPQNRLLSRGPRFRMDAEMVRDTALEASGLLVKKIGGPSVKPYQPDGVWEAIAMKESNTGKYVRDSGESLYRRSMYTFWKRQAPPATLEIFNAPNRESCTLRRERGNTPLQALASLNDTQFVEAGRVLAERAMKLNAKAEDERINYMAERLLARPLNAEEKKILEGSLRDLEAYYKSKPDEAEKLLTVGEAKADAQLEKPVLAAYTMLANELMNLDEVLNK
jgi:hypothetical protein